MVALAAASHQGAHADDDGDRHVRGDDCDYDEDDDVRDYRYMLGQKRADTGGSYPRLVRVMVGLVVVGVVVVMELDRRVCSPRT